MSDIRSIEEIQEDIRTLTRIPSLFIAAKLEALSDEVGRKFSLCNNNKYKWHDLRKNPEDLPKEMHQVEVYGMNWHHAFAKYGTFFTHDGMDRETCWVKSDAWSCSERLKGVIAWRSIEPFKEVEE